MGMPSTLGEALASIMRTNIRWKAGGHDLVDEVLREALGEAWPHALDRASLEAFEGLYTAEQLAVMVNREALLEQAFQQIKEASVLHRT